MLLVKIITAFPEMFPGVLGHSIIGNSFKKKWDLEIINLRNFGINERKTIDDTPFGGGPGMIIRPDVVEKALIQNKNSSNIKSKLIYMSPSGKQLKQQDLLKYCKFLVMTSPSNKVSASCFVLPLNSMSNQGSCVCILCSCLSVVWSFFTS